MVLGFVDGFTLPGFGGAFGAVYNVAKDYAAAAVFIAVAILAVRRRLPSRPARYDVPESTARATRPRPCSSSGLIATLSSGRPVRRQPRGGPERQGRTRRTRPAPDAGWAVRASCFAADLDRRTLQGIHLAAYAIHDLTFFFFLCFLPMGKHFHVITSLFNVFFMRLDQAT